MQLENSFTVPVPIEDAWRVLLDIERIAPCMPGAVLDSVEGDAFTGRVKVKLGPIALTYAGKASFVEKDEAAHRAVIDAKGKDQRGNGTAAAMITARLAEEGSVTRVDVLTDLNITGKPAQFGRGVMTDVGNKLLGQFADKLAAQLASSPDVDADDEAAAQKQEPTVTTAVAGAAAGAAGVAEEVAASAEQVPGDNAAAETVRKAGTAAKKAAAAASEDARTTQEIPKKAAAKKTAAPAAKLAAQTAAPPDPTEIPATGSAAGDAPATTPVPRPSTPPAATSGPPSRPGTGAPARSTPSGGTSRPQQSEPEPIDLLEVAGGAAMARLALPAAGVAGALLLVALVVRRRRRRR